MKSTVRRGWGVEKQSRTLLGEIEDFQKSTRGECGIAVGLGRSYGDSSLNEKGASWSSRSNSLISIDSNSRIATVGAGVTIGELETAALPLGLFPPVVPGTEFVTVGGAIAADIHGKSHHKFGTFSRHVLEMTVMDAAGKFRTFFPTGETREFFLATAGGMGLTGVIVSAKILLIPLETSYFTVKEERAQNLEELLELVLEFDKQFDYTVAWVDLSGLYNGRGIVTGGNHASRSELPPALREQPLKLKFAPRITIPNIFPSFTINVLSVRIFNFLWFRKPLSNGVVHFKKFLHPLDPVLEWNRIYGKKGFLQYQFVVPYDSIHFLSQVLSEMKRISAPSFISVLKKFEGFDQPYLSFPREGWTLAIDIPAGVSGLEESLSSLDQELARIGGRVYLAKDSRLSEVNFKKMYPSYSQWLEVKKSLDPENYWQSDQGRRLGLC